MPIYKKCAVIGCYGLTAKNKRFCAKHKELEIKFAEQKEQKKKEFFARLTATKQSYASFYSTAEWRNLIRRLIAEHPYCAHCGSPENLTGHHIITVYEDITKALDRDNILILCKTCHDKVTQQAIAERRALKKGT